VRIPVEGIPDRWMTRLTFVITYEVVGLRMRKARAPADYNDKYSKTKSAEHQECLQFNEHTHF
jgi:hypothetical protein